MNNVISKFFRIIRNCFQKHHYLNRVSLSRICLWLCLAYCFLHTSQLSNAATPEQISEALRLGVSWLVNQQENDGSWSAAAPVGTTGLGVAVLGHYAEELGMQPNSFNYEYYHNINDGLDYMLSQAYHDPAKEFVWFGSPQLEYAYNYVSGPVLMGIAMSGKSNQIINTNNNNLNGLTYKEVAQRIVNYLAYAQIKSGYGIGAWYYRPYVDIGDLSITGWVTLGLGYAVERLSIELPESVIENINASIDIMQQTDNPESWDYGGAGYSSNVTPPYSNWINFHKVGHLLYMMYLVGDEKTSIRVHRSIGFLERHWDSPTSGLSGGEFDLGWRGLPPEVLPSYIATVTIMKGLIALNVQELTVEGFSIDWYDDVSTVIIENQKASGAWDQGGFPTEFETLSTIWALLTLLKAVPQSPQPSIMPNAFMPASNIPANQTFKPIFETEVQIFSMKIFNRWGSIIFESNDIEVGWDGNYNGSQAPAGGYVYKVTYVYYDGTQHEHTGIVMLIR